MITISGAHCNNEVLYRGSILVGTMDALQYDRGSNLGPGVCLLRLKSDYNCVHVLIIVRCAMPIFFVNISESQLKLSFITRLNRGAKWE